MKDLTSDHFAEQIRASIQDDQTYADYTRYGAKFDLKPDHGTANINVLAPNGDAIAVTSSINTL